MSKKNPRPVIDATKALVRINAEPESLPLVPTTPEEQDKLLGIQLDMQWDEAIKGEAQQHLFGALMILLHEHLATVSTRGHGGKFGDKGTGLKAWLEKYASRVKRPTALRWMKATQGLIDKAKLKGPEQLQHLLGNGADDLANDSERAKQLELFTLIEGCSQNELLTKEQTKVAKIKAKKLTPKQAKELLHTVSTNTGEHLRTLHDQKAYIALNDKELDGLIDHLEEALKAVKAWRKMNKGDREAALAAQLAKQLKG